MAKWNFEEKHMDTLVTISLYSWRKKYGVALNVKRAFDVFRRLENQFSIFRQDSELVCLNRQAGMPVAVTPVLFETLKYALKIAEESQGVFTPLQSSGVAANYADVNLDSSTNTVNLPPQTTLDLNSIVKGLAIDMALECFGGDENIMIEAGGDIKVKGLPPKAKKWSVGIRNPIYPQKIITVIHVGDRAVCTSGEYFRKAHLINPLAKKSDRCGGKISSITVISPTAREADALSTAAYFMEIEKAVSFVEKHDLAACLIIDSDNNVYASPRMKSYFEITRL